jgi:hypothetical protein
VGGKSHELGGETDSPRPIAPTGAPELGQSGKWEGIASDNAKATKAGRTGERAGLRAEEHRIPQPAGAGAIGDRRMDQAHTGAVPQQLFQLGRCMSTSSAAA